MPTQQYGWTIVRIKRTLKGGGVVFEGGSLDGKSNGSPVLDAAKEGETWAVKVERDSPWMFGKIERAVRLEKAA